MLETMVKWIFILAFSIIFNFVMWGAILFVIVTYFEEIIRAIWFVISLPFRLIWRTPAFGSWLVTHAFPALETFLCRNFEAASRMKTLLSFTEEEVGFVMDFREQKASREAFETQERIEREQREAAQRREHERREHEQKQQKAEQERREALRKKPRPVKPRRFKDPAVTRLYMMFQDSFPLGGGFTCHGQWVDENLAAKAREVLEPCFSGEPTLKPLSTKIVKLIYADAGDPRLTVEERTSIFQLFYEPNIQTRKSTARQEESICL